MVQFSKSEEEWIAFESSYLQCFFISTSNDFHRICDSDLSGVLRIQQAFKRITACASVQTVFWNSDF